MAKYKCLCELKFSNNKKMYVELYDYITKGKKKVQIKLEKK